MEFSNEALLIGRTEEKCTEICKGFLAAITARGDGHNLCFFTIGECRCQSLCVGVLKF